MYERWPRVGEELLLTFTRILGVLNLLEIGLDSFLYMLVDGAKMTVLEGRHTNS
jgi:hypothetical protein